MRVVWIGAVGIALTYSAAFAQQLAKEPPPQGKGTKAIRSAKPPAKGTPAVAAVEPSPSVAAPTAAAAAVITAPAASAAPVDAAAAPASVAPSESPPPEPGLIAEPPGAGQAMPATVEQRSSLPLSFESLLRDLRLSDLLLALFALTVAFFAFRTSSSMAKLRSAARRQSEDSHRAAGAIEKAADAARRSAEAAEQTLTALRETAERESRAYVTVRQFLQAPVKDDRQNVHGWLLQVAWQNTGATPTKGFRYWAMMREFERSVPEDFEFTPAGLKDFAGGELGSNGTVNSPPLFISQQQIAKIQDGSRKILLLGQADYHDMVRDKKRETRFCVELVLVNDPGGANGSPFSFSYHPKHNTIT